MYKAEILWTKQICKQADRYIGWPTVAMLADGRLVAGFSGDRDWHVCPWGKSQIITSSDMGETWSEPVTVNNTPLDDRDVGMLATSKGTLILSWFTSMFFTEPSISSWIPQSMIDSWQRHIEKISDSTQQEWLGNYTRRSLDGGKTWEPPVSTFGSSPHGPIELSDGRLLYVGVPTDMSLITLCVEMSDDDGISWRRCEDIPPLAGDDIKLYSEPHSVQDADGRIVALFRYDSPDDDFYLRQTESLDGGYTWSPMQKTGIMGLPPHLIRLRDGKTVVSYGYRWEPYGERACISLDGGKTWDTENPLLLSQAPNGDLGYPASVQLPDDSILTVYYEVVPPDEKTSLVATHWRITE